MVVSLTRIAAEGFALGLATGVYCLTACAPILVPYLMAEDRGGAPGNLRLLAEFLLGRLAAYLLFALAAGWLGARFRDSLPPRLFHGAVAVTALLMILYALPLGFPRLDVCRRALRFFPGKRMPLLLGFLIGINVCPPFVQGLLTIVGLGSVAGGIFFFLVFFFATTLYTLPVLSVTLFQRRARLKNIGALASLLAGAWFLLRGVVGLAHP